MKKLVACYKAFRGGEWFEASLESIRPHTDGAVVVIGESSWIGQPDPLCQENCSQPLAAFQARHPDYPIHVRTSPPRCHSAYQYKIGLEAIAETFGPETAVLIIDTDEIWPAESLQALRDAIEQHPEIECFQGRLYSYVKSPLYQVWPPEPATPCVALQTAVLKTFLGGWHLAHNRFASAPLTNTIVPGAWFHHFTYVRETEEDLRLKFATTSSQERYPSNPDWWEKVWPNLPEGTDIHMTPHCEHCWPAIRVITPGQLPPQVAAVAVFRDAIQAEERAWKQLLQTVPPDQALVPVPTDPDAAKYSETLACLTKISNFTEWANVHLKTTYLEALWLAFWAGRVPLDGRILEIGCGHGGSTAILARSSHQTVLIDTVDPFVPYSEEGTSGIVHGIEEGDEAVFWESAQQLGYLDRLRHYWLSSRTVAPQLQRKYDLIFVDGNHSTEIVSNDLRIAWQRLKPGGLLVGHDYTTRFPGVLRAVRTRDWLAQTKPFPNDLVEVATPVGTSLFYAPEPEI